MPSADQVPVKSPHSMMHWHMWVVPIAGSTGSALRAVRPPNLLITRSRCLSFICQRGRKGTLARSARGSAVLKAGAPAGRRGGIRRRRATACGEVETCGIAGSQIGVGAAPLRSAVSTVRTAAIVTGPAASVMAGPATTLPVGAGFFGSPDARSVRLPGSRALAGA